MTEFPYESDDSQDLTFGAGVVSEDRAPMTVSQITAGVRRLLEGNFSGIWVEGEITNWSVAGSGHAYFALKDENALLSCVMWRSSLGRLKHDFRDGDLVEARGNLTVYDKRGQYQLLVNTMKPVGDGLLYAKFLELKERLEREGLFDPYRKKPIPRLPASVGIVTSPTGAAIRDVLSVIKRRAPGLRVYIWPARVQGEGAARELAAGVTRLAESGLAEVIILTRGGGSLEDLWQFNDENLARAIEACPVPVISAVGHEVDFSISDFVADLRAATPSAAAELVSAEQQLFHARVCELSARVERAIDARLRDARQRLRRAAESYALRQPEALLRESQQRTDEALRRLDDTIDRRLVEARHRAAAANASLSGHDPALILRKGYAIVRDAKTGKLVTQSARLRSGQHVRTQLHDGLFRSAVVEDHPDLFEGG